MIKPLKPWIIFLCPEGCFALSRRLKFLVLWSMPSIVSFELFKSQQWSASNFSLQYHNQNQPMKEMIIKDQMCYYPVFQIREGSQVKNPRSLLPDATKWMANLRRFRENQSYWPLKILHWLSDFESYLPTYTIRNAVKTVKRRCILILQLQLACKKPHLVEFL